MHERCGFGGIPPTRLCVTASLPLPLVGSRAQRRTWEEVAPFVLLIEVRQVPSCWAKETVLRSWGTLTSGAVPVED